MNSTFQHARIVYELKRYDEALVLLQKAHLEDPENIEIYVLTAWCYYLTKRANIGLKVAGQALAVDPQNVRALLIHGACASFLGQPNIAHTSLSSALAINPQNAFAYYLMAFHRVKQHLYKPALELINQAITFEPNSSTYLSFRSQIQTLLGQNEHAKESALQALQLNPEIAHGHLLLGKIRRGEGNLKDSIESLKSAVRSDPNDERVCEELLDSLRCRFPPYRWIHIMDYWLSHFSYWKRALFWTSPLSLGSVGIVASCLLYINESFLASKIVITAVAIYAGIFLLRFALKHFSYLFLDGFIAFDPAVCFVLPRPQRLFAKISIIVLAIGTLSLLAGWIFHSKDALAFGIAISIACFLMAYTYSMTKQHLYRL